jgi:hypothetical protein
MRSLPDRVDRMRAQNRESVAFVKLPFILIAFHLAALPALYAGWYVDNSAAAAHLKGSKTLGPYPTRAAAQAVVDANNGYGMRVMPNGSDDATPGGTAAPAPAAAGHEFDNTINQAISAGISGQISGADAVGLVGIGLIGNAMFAPQTVDPAAQQRALAAQRAAALAAQEAAAAAAAAQAEAAAAAERKRQAKLARLRGLLKTDTFDGDRGGDLLLKGVAVASDGELARDAKGKLTLKPVDDESAGELVHDAKGKLALKSSDEDLKPAGTRAAANSGEADAPPSDTAPMVVDLRGTAQAATDPTSPIMPVAEPGPGVAQSGAPGAPAPAAAPVAGGAGLREMQEASAAYHQSRSDEPTIRNVALPEIQDEPRSMVQKARQMARDAGYDALGDASFSLIEKIPGVATTKGVYDDFQEMNASLTGVTDDFGNLFMDHAYSAIEDLGSPGNLNGLPEEHFQQLNKRGKEAEYSLRRDAIDKAYSGYESKQQQDEDLAGRGDDVSTVVPVNFRNSNISSPFPLRP